MHAPIAHTYWKDAVDAIDLSHRVDRRSRRYDVSGAVLQTEYPCPALTVDTADDGKLLDKKTVVVTIIDWVEKLPGNSIHVAGDGEQLYPVTLSPELALDGLRDDFGP